MSNTLNIQFWQTQQPGFKYPEADPASAFYYKPFDNRPNSSGICVSGGGSVSASLIAGYYAALQELNIMGGLRYVSGVSGGTWGSAPFIYKATGYKNFSGVVKAPGALTTNDITTTVPGSMQDAVTKANIADQCVFYLGLSTADNRNQVYEKAVGSLFLVPFSIKSPVLDASKRQFFSSTSDVVKNIQKRNPSLTNGFMTVGDDMPFLIMNTTMFVPANGNNYIYPFEVTPLYCGIKAPQTAGDNGQNIGGFFVESFGFNTTLISGSVSGNTAQATCNYPFELCQPVGASGSALEGMLIKDNSQLVNCFPQFNYWNPLYPTQNTQQYNFGDGGCIEDTGITPLLARGLQNIAAFLTEPVFFPGTDTVSGVTNFDERAFGYNQIAALFGMPTINADASKTATTNPIIWYPADPAKQVFDNSNGQFNTLLNALLAARTSGNPMVVNMTMDVVECDLYGITPTTGYKPQVIWSVVDVATNWTNNLSNDAKTYITKHPDEMADFPVVKVFGQNIASVIKLTAGQTNLLADFAYWMVTTNKSTYTSVLGTAKVLAEAEAELA